MYIITSRTRQVRETNKGISAYCGNLLTRWQSNTSQAQSFTKRDTRYTQVPWVLNVVPSTLNVFVQEVHNNYVFTQNRSQIVSSTSRNINFVCFKSVAVYQGLTSPLVPIRWILILCQSKLKVWGRLIPVFTQQFLLAQSSVNKEMVKCGCNCFWIWANPLIND